MSMSMSLAFTENNVAHLKNVDDNSTSLLLMAIILAVVSVILIGFFIFYLYQFNKIEAKAKMFGKKWIIGLGFLGLIACLMWITSIVVYAQNSYQQPKTLLIVLLSIGFGSLIISMLTMWFLLPKFGIAIAADRIIFIGEKILISSITNIMRDNTKNRIYVNFRFSRRSYKRYKFAINSAEGRFILNNVNLIAAPFETGNEDEYFKNLTSLSQPTQAPTEKK